MLQSITQIFSGKAFARALRGYFLVAAGLEEVFLLKQIVFGGVHADCEIVSDADMSTITELYVVFLDSCVGSVNDAVESVSCPGKTRWYVAT